MWFKNIFIKCEIVALLVDVGVQEYAAELITSQTGAVCSEYNILHNMRNSEILREILCLPNEYKYRQGLLDCLR